MERKIKVFQIGCGKMSKFIFRYATEKNCEIVGAVDCNPKMIGQSINTIVENINPKITIEDDKKLEELLIQSKPDIAIITTMSTLNDLANTLRICAKCGVNTITTCEEAFFSENSNPTLHEEINRLAKATNCTITGAGYQDIFWGNLISTIASSTHKITKIKGSSSYNVEDYGIALADAHGAGFTIEKFENDIASLDNISSTEREKLIQNRKFMASYMWNVVGWLADKLGFTITEMDQKCLPIIADNDLESNTLNMTVQKGLVRGMSAVVTAHTKEGVEIEAECIGKIYTKEECDKNEWSILGEPDTTIVVNRPATSELTCADIVNRIPDVINAPSGFIPTSRLTDPKYRLKNLNEYVEKEQ
ncbi:MAG: dihydrodipicolinate reductase [Bacilli bacterium]|nr:dihydrodipicolinate reductase [Bacilli bacterium]